MKLLCGLFLILTANAAFAAKPESNKGGVQPNASLPACSTMMGTNELCGQIVGTLSNPQCVSGDPKCDPLGLAGSTITAVTGTLDPTQESWTSWQSGWSVLNAPINPGSSHTYTGVPLALVSNASPLTLTCIGGATVQLVASSSGDQLNVQSCSLGLAIGDVPLVGSSFTGTISFPGGTLPQALQIPFPSATVGSGSTITYVCGLGSPECPSTDPTTLTFSSGSTISASCIKCTTIGVEPAVNVGLSFTVGQGGTASPQTVTVIDNNGAVVNWAAVVSSGAPWLSIVTQPGGQIGGAGPSTFNVGVTPGSMGVGTYTGSITVYAPSANDPTGSVVEPVTLTITAPSVTLVPSATSLTFNSVNGSTPPTQGLTVGTNPSGAQVPFTATTASTGSWLGVSPTSGTTNSTGLTVSASAGIVPAGANTGTLTLASVDAPTNAVVNVTLNETTIPTPSQLSFSTTPGVNPPTQSLTVGATGPNVTFTVSASSSGWLAVSSGTFTTNSATKPTVTVTTGSLGAGAYSGTLTITPQFGNPIQVSVQFTVNALPTLGVTPTTMTFSSVAGSTPNSQNATVTVSTGTVSFAAAASSTGSWLSVSPTSGTATTGGATAAISASAAGLATGTYNGTVTFTCNPTSACSNPSGVTVSVTLTVTATLSATPTTLTFNYTPGGSTPASQGITVSSNGGAITYTAVAASSANWLAVSPASATTPTGVTASVNAAVLSGLTPGQTYTGTITLTPGSPNTGPVTVNASLIVASPPTLSTTTNQLNFSYQLSGTQPASQQFTANSSGTAINLNASVVNGVSGGNTWLTVSPTSGTTPQAFTVGVVTTNLTAGTYNGSILLSCNPAASCANTGGTLSVGVTLNVSSQPVFTPTPASLTFNYTLGGTVPGSQPVTITSSNTVSGVTATPSVNWLSASLSGTTTGPSAPVSMTVSLVQANLPTTAGSYPVSIAIAGTGATTLTYPVTLVVAPQPTLSVTPTSLTFSGTAGGANPAAQTLTVNGANGTISFTAAASSTGGWLSVSPTSGSTNTTLQVTVSTSGLNSGQLLGSIVVTATSPTGVAGSPVTIPVTLNLSANPLAATPTALTFNYTLGTSGPAAQNLSITSTVAGVAFTAAAASAPWLSISPTGGTTPASLSVSILTSGLTAGTYNATIVATPTGSGSSPVSVPVTLNVSSTPQVTASPTSLTFNYFVNGSTPASQMVLIAAGSTGVSYTTSATSSGNWLAVSPASGTTPSSITVSLQNLTGLAVGNYSGSVTVTVSPTNSVTIPVTLNVNSQPSITASPTTLTFSYVAGGTVPNGQSVAVATSNNAAASVTATTSASWLAAHLSSGTTPTSALVSIVPGNLTAGTYNGTVTLAASGYTSATVNVTLTITQPTAVIQISGNTAFTLANTSAPATATLSISASDGSAQPFTVTLGSSQYAWASISPTSGTSPGTVTLTANPAGLPPGVYITPITVTMSNLPVPTKTIQAQLTVTGSNLAASPAMLTFNYQPAAAFPPAQTIALTTASGGAPVTIASVTTSVGWITVTSSSTMTPATLTVGVNPGLLTPGTYYGSVQVKAVGSPTTSLSIPVTIVVSAAPQISAVPATLAFAYQVGGSSPAGQSVAVSSSNNVAVNYTVTAPAWLTVSPSTGTTPGSVLITPNTMGLGAGTYTGTVSIFGYGVGTATVAVTLTVTGAPQLTISPSSLSFAFPSGGAAPGPQTLTLMSAGGPLSFTAVAGSSWLSVTPTSGTTPATLAVSVNTAGLTNGLYNGTINITVAGNPVPLLVLVSLGIGPTPTITGIINAASGATGEIAPGMAVSIFGTTLGPASGTTFAPPPTAGTVATSLAGTQVWFDGTPVPVIFTITGQVNVLAPFTFANTSTAIQVSYNGVPSATMTLPVVATEPGLFTADASGKGQGAILNQDYSVNSSSQPAAQGSAVMLFGTGCGTTDPASVLGQYNPIPPPLGALTAMPVTAMVGGQNATVDYSGPAPGLVSGICQINVTLPAGLSSGSVPVTVTVGTATSQTVTVAVQ